MKCYKLNGTEILKMIQTKSCNGIACPCTLHIITCTTIGQNVSSLNRNLSDYAINILESTMNNILNKAEESYV